MPARIAVGDPLPDLALPDAAGAQRRLRDLIGARGLVVYFYPRDHTPGCTAQACAFRDSYADFTDAGVAVVGISGDDGAAHRGFAEDLRLPFTLLSDADGAARAAFGVPSTLGLMPGRVTYVADRAGVVRLVFNSQLRPKAHIRAALDVLATLG